MFVYISSLSSHVYNMDFLHLLLLSIPIIDRSWLVFKAAIRACTELVYISLCRSANTQVSVYFKCLEKKLDGNYSKMLSTVLTNPGSSIPKKQQLYGYLPLTSQIIHVWWIRHVGHSWRSWEKFLSEVLWSPTYGHWHTHINYTNNIVCYDYK